MEAQAEQKRSTTIELKHKAFCQRGRRNLSIRGAGDWTLAARPQQSRDWVNVRL